jgi:hypothetical protein
MAALKRLSQPLTLTRLEQVLSGEHLATEPVPSVADISSVATVIADLPDSATGSELDVALVQALHEGLRGLTRAEAADMRVWHWMAAVAFPAFVWRRWRPEGPPPPESMSDDIGDAMFRRFAGSASLNGVSRNTFARLWWTAETVRGDYRLARVALSRQDMFQAIFERHFGMYEPAARAAITIFDGRRESEIRVAARWLTYVASTTVLEVLDEQQITEILREGLRAAA